MASRRWRRAVSFVCAALLAGCAARPARLAAERGDRAALHDSIAARQRAGGLTNAEAACLARAVADHEVRAASGPEAVARVRDVRA
ncbi:MAG: hypothetical protein JOZ69_13890, partial [Myxococcales bacterium]|nr:hypothetical protein [Myxococcales bacterium]